MTPTRCMQALAGLLLASAACAEVTELETMVGANYDRPANWASNLLCAIYLKCRAPYTGDVPIPKSNNGRTRNSELPQTALSTYGVQPNPVRTHVAFTYNVHSAGEPQGRIIVRDLAGRMVATLIMAGLQGQQVWDTRSVAPGTYLIQYLRGEDLVHTEKLIIQQ